jgi:hypothetical protein
MKHGFWGRKEGGRGRIFEIEIGIGKVSEFGGRVSHGRGIADDNELAASGKLVFNWKPSEKVAPRLS